MSHLETSRVTSSATSSPALAAGAKPCYVQAFLLPEDCGREAVHVRPFPAPGSRRVSRTSETCGPSSSGSSASVALNSSLVSRLKTLCATVGSTVYTQTWKEKVTPAGLRYWAHTARGPTTSGSGFTGWPTPNTPSGGRTTDIEKMDATGKMSDGRKHAASLEHAVKFAGWGTPRVTTNGGIPCPESTGKGSRLEDQAAMAGWTTPSASDGNRGGEITPNMTGTSLAQQVQAAGWPTPKERDYHKEGKGQFSESLAAMVGWATPAASEARQGYQDRTRGKKGSQESLSTQAVNAISGRPPSHTSAETASLGALNPAFSRWLQGHPEVWDTAAILAHRLMSTRRTRHASCASKATATA